MQVSQNLIIMKIKYMLQWKLVKIKRVISMEVGKK